MVALLDRIGEARWEDIGSKDRTRVLSVATYAPLDPPYENALFEYTEIYERAGKAAWRRIEYLYEFQQRPPPGRRAHHLHPPFGHHAHCVDPRQPEPDDHYRDVDVDVFEAHAEFLRWYALGQPMDCFGLFPLAR